MKLIDKDSLVAKVERRLKALYKDKNFNYLQIKELKALLSSLNTLEVKEVDFEKIWKEYFKYRGDVATVNVKHLAKHFFKLGIEKSVNESIIRKIVELNNEAVKHYADIIKKEREENGFSQLAIDLFDNNVDAKELRIQYIIENLKAQKGE